MKQQPYFAGMIGILVAIVFLASCIPTAPAGPCGFTANVSLTAYRTPDATSSVFGTISSGDSFEVMARTADGWVGFDPGVAQAGNVGLARNRWVQLNASLSPSCLSSVDLVTLSDVEADVAASGG
jgi:hypothetical protein